MAIALDATLLAQQDEASRKPIAKLISANAEADIPFYGSRLGTAESAYTLRPHIITLADGRLAALYMDDSVVKYVYTDAGKTEWTIGTSTFTMPTGYSPYGGCLVELASGNIGALIRATNASSTYNLLYAEITSSGGIVTAPTSIATYTSPKIIGEPHCIMLADETFLVVYAKYVLTGETATYSIQKRTASAWGSFSAESSITLSGVDTTKPITNAGLLQMSDGDIFLAYDIRDYVSGDNEIWNIYSMISDDDGGTWSAPEARSNYSDYGYTALHPMMGQKSDGTVYMVYYDQTQVLSIYEGSFDHDTVGAYNHGVKYLHYDAARGNLLAVWRRAATTGQQDYIIAVTVTDVATWTVTKSYYTASTPALNAFFNNNSPVFASGGGQYIFLARGKAIAQIDTDADTIRYYVVGGTLGTYYSGEYGLLYNTSGFAGPDISGIDYDETSQRLWVVNHNRMSIPYKKIYWGYLDVTQAAGAEGYYEYDIVCNYINMDIGNNELETLQYIEEYNYLLMSFSNPYYLTGMTWLVGAEDTVTVKKYTHALFGGYPWKGLVHACFVNDHIYGDFTYVAVAPETDKRGLCDINITNDIITYHRPTYATVDQYWFYDYTYDSVHDRLIIAATTYGVTLYDVPGQYWTLYSPTNTPGLFVSGYGIRAVDYDADTEMVFMGVSGTGNTPPTNAGAMQAMNINGAINQLSYNTYAESWGTAATLAYYYNEREPACTIDEDDILWVIWSRYSYSTGLYTLYYDRDAGAIDISDDLTGELSISWELKTATSVVFQLARGHLYDPQNSLSLLSPALKKGRFISVYLGDDIGGTEYWQQQCLVYVRETRVNYTRGDYPVITATCHDIREIFSQLEITTSEFYDDQYPEDVLADLLEDFGGLTSAQYDIPVFSLRHTAKQQYVDLSLQEVIDIIAAHWFYTAYVDYEGKYTFLLVDLDKPADHVYSDISKIVEFTPDDTYSVFTNRITVRGESDDLTPVTYAEELVASVNGTTGWYDKKVTKKVWYSEDHEKECIYPRLEIVQSIKLQGLLAEQLGIGDGSEEITEEGDAYCVITIQVPDLTAAVVVACAAAVYTGYLALSCDYYRNCGAYVLAANLSMTLLFGLISAIANYQYEVYANPTGTVQTTIQYSEDDTEFQQQIGGIVVPVTIDDTLAITVNECRRIAEGEMAMVRAQRNRVAFKKITHLQDEITDKLTLRHPYSSETLDILITKLTRTYSKGEGMFDAIEGWRTS